MISNRLTLVLVLAAVILCVPPFAMAQGQAKVFRIGAVSAGAPRSSPHWVAFAQRLGELGYVEGRNVSIEFRSAEGRPERFSGLMSELVRLGVDVIVPVGPEASLRAAQEATTAVPIVVVAIDYDPIVRGYVAGLARPGGNTTGLFLRQPELTGKTSDQLHRSGQRPGRPAVDHLSGRGSFRGGGAVPDDRRVTSWTRLGCGPHGARR
jgi:putative tryptophan/tyrosine transport system substrate-binding protein